MLTKQMLRGFCSYYPKNLNMAASNTFYFKDLERNVLPDDQRQQPNLDLDNLKFGAENSEHMLSIEWEGQWKKPVLKPFEHLKIHPFNSTLHYAIQCYEGLKAYKDEKGKVRLFRPECNMYRFKQSSKRIGLPDFDGWQMLKCLQEFVKIESRWIPSKKGYSLYLRPFHFSMENTLGIKSPAKSNLLLVASPVGPYYRSGFNPISVSCDPKHIRSAPGGTGGYKVGSNYGSTIPVAEQANKKGFSQVLWMFNGKIGQVGTSNIFFVVKSGDGIEVITPMLEDLVLPGVTRDSIIKFIRHKGIKLTERVIMIDEIVEKAMKKQLVQVFASGTAVIVSPVKSMEYMGKTYEIPLDQEKKAGHLTYEIFDNILGIQEGRIKDPFGWSKLIKD